VETRNRFAPPGRAKTLRREQGRIARTASRIRWHGRCCRMDLRPNELAGARSIGHVETERKGGMKARRMARSAGWVLAIVNVAANGRGVQADPRCAERIPVYVGGRVESLVCPEDVPGLGLTAIHVAEDFVPRALRAEPGTELSYAAVYQALASERGEGVAGGAAEERFLELWGVFPGFSVLRGRLADRERHLCHDQIDDAGLAGFEGALIHDDRTPDPARRAPDRRAAIRAAQLHLVCDGMLAAEAVDERLGPRTGAALTAFRRRHMVAQAGDLDQETRALLATDTRELDYRSLLRGLRERVVDASGLIEDGSARGVWGSVLERTIDPASVRDSAGHAPLAAGAPDLVSPATEAAARALGWTDPDAALRALDRLAGEGHRQVAVQLPPRPRYHRPAMQLRAEIDRGDVWYDDLRTPSGARRRRPRERRPVLILYARDGDREVALARWPTTIGTWQREKLSSGAVVTRYKASPVGSFQWREMVAAPAWFAPPSTPDRELVRRTSRGWLPREDTIGPGYRSAYGLVAIVHRNERGGDTGVRTHGTVNYLSVSQGNGSHGCHRLLTFQALRLGGFLLAHRRFVTIGERAEAYRRHIRWGGKTFVIARSTRGYTRVLDPPVPVRVLPGRVLGRAKQPSRRSR
jgi:hypothetical protein